MPRRAARVDANHASIVAAARQMGCKVLDLSKVGRGCPDLLLQAPPRLRNRLYLVEVKDGAKSASRRVLTPQQVEFHKDWPVHVVTSLDDLLALLR